MVDRVELALRDEVPQVGDLDDRPPIRFDEPSNGSHESVRVRYMSQDVVRVEHIGPLALLHETVGERLGQEGVERRKASLHGDPRRAFGWIDPEDRNPEFMVLPEQVPVVGSGLDDEAVLTEGPTL